MSWSIEQHIGELRPWPDSVTVVRGRAEESRRYVPESENAKLREDLEDQEGFDQMLRDRLRQQTELYVKAKSENAKLRELVKAFDWCTENFDIRDKCEQCPLKQSSTLEPECEVLMRELGLEGGVTSYCWKVDG